jgi:hypothetical protein
VWSDALDPPMPIWCATGHHSEQVACAHHR